MSRPVELEPRLWHRLLVGACCLAPGAAAVLTDVPADVVGPVGVVAAIAAVALSAGRRGPPQPAEPGEVPFRQLFDEAPIGMIVSDLQGRVVQVNDACCTLLGHPREALEGMHRDGLLHPDEQHDMLVRRARLLAGEERVLEVQTRLVHADGHTLHVLAGVSVVRDGAGRPHRLLTQVVDATERHRFEGQLAHLVDHDPLTGLFNRRRFESELERELAAAQRHATGGAVLVCDLDHFKYVNDSLGHPAGDELIARIAGVFRRRLRRTDVLARLGGDEFAVVLAQVGEDEARLVAESLLEAVRQDGHVGADEALRRVSGSIGVAMFAAATRLTGEELLVEADIAMYDAKEAGRDCFVLFDPEQSRQLHMQARLTWAERIRGALAEDGFVLHAQPIVGLNGDEEERYELLVRMLGDDGDLIPPGAFLGIAERFGLIEQLDRWVVGEAIRMLAVAARSGMDVRFEVNLSARSVCDAELPDAIAAQIAAAGVDPRRLCFEVTETAAIVNVERAKQFATRLSRLGCEFALDDFGAGFASFYYLKHLAFDYLKIDGEFITDLVGSRTNQLVVRSVVDIARGLGKRTVAEFVGDEPTLELLRSYGVDFAQGFHVGRPGPLDLRPRGDRLALPG